MCQNFLNIKNSIRKLVNVTVLTFLRAQYAHDEATIQCELDINLWTMQCWQAMWASLHDAVMLKTRWSGHPKGKIVENSDKSKSTIDLEQMTCTCSRYLDKAICKHLVAGLLRNKTDFPGLKPLVPKKTFSYRMRKRKEKLTDESSVLDELATQTATQTSPEPAPQLVTSAKPKRSKFKSNQQPARSSSRIAKKKEDTISTSVKIPKAGRPANITKALQY